MKNNYPKRIVCIKSDNRWCKFICNSNVSFIHIQNVKLSDKFFYHYTLNLFRIYSNIVDALTIFLFDGQKFFLANTVLRISFEKLLKLLVINYTILKTNRVAHNFHNYFWSNENIDLIYSTDVLMNTIFLIFIMYLVCGCLCTL